MATASALRSHLQTELWEEDCAECLIVDSGTETAFGGSFPARSSLMGAGVCPAASDPEPLIAIGGIKPLP